MSTFPTLWPIIIGVHSIEKSKEFYIKVFGLKIEEESLNYLSGRCIDGTHIEIEEDSEDRFPHWAERNIGTYKNSEFHITDIHSFLSRVEEYGWKIVSKPESRPWWLYVAEFSDIDGNIFLISQH